ncbi:MAG: HD domain-containing phosphohydrolase [Pseudomonadota bacterium]
MIFKPRLYRYIRNGRRILWRRDAATPEAKVQRFFKHVVDNWPLGGSIELADVGDHEPGNDSAGESACSCIVPALPEPYFSALPVNSIQFRKQDDPACHFSNPEGRLEEVVLLHFLAMELRAFSRYWRLRTYHDSAWVGKAPAPIAEGDAYFEMDDRFRVFAANERFTQLLHLAPLGASPLDFNSFLSLSDRSELQQRCKQEHRRRDMWFGEPVSLQLIDAPSRLAMLTVYHLPVNNRDKAQLCGFLDPISSDSPMFIGKSFRLVPQGKAWLRSADTLAEAMEVMDLNLSTHQRHVAHLACAIAKRMKAPDVDIQTLRTAAMLHDIGRLATPSELWSRSRSLTAQERALAERHTVLGAEIANTIGTRRPVARVILEHHERDDGSGYPGGKMAADILPESRILAVADVTVALLSHRPHRKAWQVNSVLSHLQQERGAALWEDAVDACCAVLIAGQLPWLPLPIDDGLSMAIATPGTLATPADDHAVPRDHSVVL